MLESIAENVPILLMYTDAAQRLRLANCESRRWFGMDPVWGVHLRKFLGVETYALISKEIDEALTLSEVRWRELQVAVAHGETRWLSLRILPEIGRYEGVEGLFFVGLDITTQRRKVKAERELTERTAAINEIARRVAPDASSSEILSGAADTLNRIIPSGIASWGSVGETGRLKIAYSASEPKEETQPGRDLDVDLTQVPDCLTMLRQGTTLTIQDVAQEPGFTDLRASFQAAQVRALMGKSVQSGEGHLDLLLVHSDQATRWSYHHVKMLEEVSQYLASALEKVYAFEAVRTEEQIRAEQALRDPLTGLPNRRIFDELLAQVLAQSRRNQKLFALLYLDLDDFKLVNDRFGHAAGDEFLKTISERLKGLVRETDTVARLGGDEFSILLSEISRPQHSGMLAEKVLSGLTKPVSLDEGIVDVSASIGISIYPFDGEDESELLKKADKAMYEAKKQGKNAYCHYSPSISLAEKRRGERKRSLIRAFDRDEFVLHYQPMLDLEARRILGVEAFLRWQLPGEDMLFPEQFISSVEDLGLSERMLEWVLEAACVQARAWKSENILSFPISLNMGRRDLSREDLPTIVQTALAEAGLESKSLMLEFTELALMENEESRKNLEQLADLGVRLLVDDFGTGYFSLRHLSRLPIHALKLSQELVALLPGDDRIAVTANAVLALGRNMGVRVIAEAVESKEQLLFLSKNGCSSCQGKLFGGPVSPGLIPEVIGRYQLSSEG
jgi:diguanylate cyclase (GGDEF)-like protein